MNLEEFHKKKNILFADIILFFNKEPESFYMFPDDLIKRLNNFMLESKEMINQRTGRGSQSIEDVRGKED